VSHTGVWDTQYENEGSMDLRVGALYRGTMV